MVVGLADGVLPAVQRVAEQHRAAGVAALLGRALLDGGRRGLGGDDDEAGLGLGAHHFTIQRGKVPLAGNSPTTWPVRTSLAPTTRLQPRRRV